MANKRKPAVSDELLDQLLGGSDALEAFQSGELVQDLKRALAERILNAELDHHLDDGDEQASGNHRNGHSRKRVLTDDGRMELSIPRDRQGRFNPKLIEKYCRRLYADSKESEPGRVAESLSLIGALYAHEKADRKGSSKAA